MRWVKKEAQASAVKELAARYGLDLLDAAILVRRGLVSPGELLYYLEDDPRYLHNPFLFEGMEDAVDRILLARDEKEKVLVFGDRDADGVTSTVLAVEALRELGLEVEWRVPQGLEAYGLSRTVLEEFAAAGGTLVVTVDCGISNHEEVERAAELGVDVLVLDHHLLKAPEVPAAVAVVDPKLPDSGYPFRDLAGCGVAYKLACALKFARSGLYKQQVALLNVRPVNEAYLVEAVRLSNLAPTARLSETIVPGMVDLSNTRLLPFLRDRQIFVWGLDVQKKLFAKAFGRSAELQAYDLAPDVAEAIPQAKGLSLLRLRELSTIGRYRDRPLEEIDVFENLFVSFALKKAAWFGEDDLSRLQLVALGTVADLMPLRDENRILVRRGLAALNQRPRPGVAELMQKLQLGGKKLGAVEAAWQLTPVVNAAGRMGRADAAVRLFLSEDAGERASLAEELVAMNLERRRLGAESWDALYPLARESLAAHGEKLVVVGSDGVHRGITGVIASKMTNVFSVPAVVASFQGDGTVVGSVRSARGFDVTAFLDASAELFIDYGGHDAAAGFSLKASDWPEFERRALSYAEGLELGTEEERIEIDAELPHDYLKPELAALAERFEPYGEENRPLVFLAKNVPIASADIVGKREANHLKLTLDFGKHKWPALFWSAAERLERDFSATDRIDLVFKVTVNRYMGMETPQLEVLDARRSEGA
ncbi:MAG TPA: single-stranded-DNA-specific exonuclease RecJ [Spirochaetia bacterium]|nr:single-stranded-DNA-specific exonuclease RecJ [Spirochaetia bacterium]